MEHEKRKQLIRKKLTKPSNVAGRNYPATQQARIPLQKKRFLVFFGLQTLAEGLAAQRTSI